MAAGSRDSPVDTTRRAVDAAVGGAWRTGLIGRDFRVPRFSAIWLATALLFAVSPVLAPGSDNRSALLSTLPFAAILAIAAIGQTLVIQQRGLDLSVAGMITLATIIVTKYPNGSESKLPAALGLVALACVISGLVSGFAITQLGITPLVATLGVNAILTGVVLQITSGAATASATPALARFSLAKTGGVPNTLIIAAVAVGALAAVMRTSVLGRRFIAVGTSPAAAHAAGIRVRTYQVSTYVVASLAYGAAGVLIAGFLGTPGIGAGNDYLLPTIAAVVLGGTSLAGGMGSVAATAVGAVFLTQLEQVVLGMGAPNSIQLVIQGAIIALGMALRQLPTARFRAVLGRLRRVPVSSQPLSLSLEGANDPPPLEQHDDRLADPRRPSSPPGSRRKL
jgi:ribose transport system permease protein